MVTLTRSSGSAPDERLEDIARLRIRVFRDFPSRHDGNLDCERRYLEIFAQTAGKVQ